MTENYSNTSMIQITESDYETLLVHLVEQLVAAMRGQGFPEDEAPKTACDFLTNAWRDDLTANEWLHAAGRELGVDTTDCVGA